MAKTWTIEVGALGAQPYKSIGFDSELETKLPTEFKAKIKYNGSIDFFDLVQIKRDGTVEWKGFVETIEIDWDDQGRYMYISGRDTRVILWKKWSENFSNMHEDTKGFFGSVSADELIQFFLRTPKSDLDQETYPNNKEGWGIDASKIHDISASRTSVGDPNWVKLRRNGYGWRNSGTPFATEQDVVDAILCGDGVQPDCDSQPAWTPHGLSPYLDVADDANYIEAGGGQADATAIFTFADLDAAATSVEKVYLTVVWRPDQTWWFWINSECAVYISVDGGTTWGYTGNFGGRESPIKPNPWRYFTWNVSDYVDTVAKFNALRIKFVNKSTSLSTYITQAYLTAGYTTGGTQMVADRFDIPFAEEEIVGIYVESRMDNESYPRNYDIVTVNDEEEDFSGYTEEDPNSHIAVVGTDHIDFEAYQSEDAWLRYDYGVDYFGTYFKHTFDVTVVTDPVPEDGIMAGVWALTNDLDDLWGLINASKDFVALYVWKDPDDIIAGGAPVFVLREQDGGGATSSISGELTEGTTYSVEIERVGTSLIAIIYVGATVFATLSITLTGGNSYRYIMPAVTAHDGAESLLSSYSELNDDGAVLLQAVHPSAGASDSAYGQCFPISVAYDARLTKCKFHMDKIGLPIGNLRAALYEITGTYGVDAKPTGSILADSNDVAMASLAVGARALVTFTFPAPYYMMDQTKKYFIVVYIHDATTLDALNYVRVGHDTTAPTAVGNRAFYDNSAWTGDNTRDVCYYVYGKYDVYTDIDIDDLRMEKETILVSVTNNIYRDIVHSWIPAMMDHIRIKITVEDLTCSWAITQVYIYKSEDCDYRVLRETGELGTLYLRDDDHTVNGLNALKLGATQSSTGDAKANAFTGAKKKRYWGVRVWKRSSGGSETEITSGVPVALVTRNENGEGLQSNAWNCPTTALISTDAIRVRVYGKFEGAAWFEIYNAPYKGWITEQVGENKTIGGVWTFYYYTYYLFPLGADTYTEFKWGKSVWNSHVIAGDAFTFPSEQYIQAISIDTSYTDPIGPLNVGKGRLIDVINSIVKICNASYIPYEWWIALDVTNTFHIKNQRGTDLSGSISFVKGTNLGGTRKTGNVSDTTQRIQIIGQGEGTSKNVASDWQEDTGEMANVHTFFEDVLSEKTVAKKDVADELANICLTEEAPPKTQITVYVNNDSYASMAYNVGDDVTITDSLTGVSGSHRIFNIVKEIDDNGEQIIIVLGSPRKTAEDEWKDIYRRLKNLELVGVIASDWSGQALSESKVDVQVVTSFFEKTAKNDEENTRDAKDPSWYVVPNPAALDYVDATGYPARTPQRIGNNVNITNGRRWERSSDWMRMWGPNAGAGVQTFLVELRGPDDGKINIQMSQNPKFVCEMQLTEDLAIPTFWYADDYFDIGIYSEEFDYGFVFRLKALGGGIFNVYAVWNLTGNIADEQEQLIRTIDRNVKYRYEILTEAENGLVIFNVYDVEDSSGNPIAEQKYPPSVVVMNVSSNIVVRPLYMLMSANSDGGNPNIRAVAYIYRFRTEWEKVMY